MDGSFRDRRWVSWMLDTEADWPAGTYRVDSYDMSCFHRIRGKSLPVFSIRFHDYPGGYVTSQTEQREFIEDKVQQYTSVMALIDGRKLLGRLEDQETNPAHSLQRDLDSLVRVLQQCVPKPIHFVLTKADLFDGSSFSLNGLLIVDEKKMLALGDREALELFRAGELSWIYAHLMSLANLNGLVERLAALRRAETATEKSTDEKTADEKTPVSKPAKVAKKSLV